jgi:hypothetical protein
MDNSAKLFLHYNYYLIKLILSVTFIPPITQKIYVKFIMNVKLSNLYFILSALKFIE